MKQIFFCSFVLLSVSTCAQIQTHIIKPGDITNITLRKESAETTPLIHFSQLKIIDSRSDTTNVGYSNRKPVKKYSFKKGFADEMKNWFSKYLDINGSGDGNTLLVNIKKLRVSEEATLKVLENGKIGQPKNGWEEGVIIKIEYYLQKDSLFIPLYRYDSIIPLRGKVDKYKETFISIGLRSSLEKLLTLKPDDLLTKRKITLNDIQQSNNRGTDLPVYMDTVHKKGIYKTFTDFKMGVISFTDFELRKGKAGDIIYVKENGNEYPLRNLWGYCDGNNFYINSGDKYSKLISVGSTFYFEGMKSWTITTYKSNMAADVLLGVPTNFAGINNSGGGGSSGYTEYAVVLKYYQLDMENGNVY